ALSDRGPAAITIYHDPTLTIGPGIVRDLVAQFVDGFAGALIATEVAAQGLAGRGLAVEPTAMQGLAADYAAWVQGGGPQAALQTQAPSGGGASTDDAGALIMGGVMAGMMIFYAFFTGASTAETILKEQEEGTLARLFTTPTAHSAILGGKFVAVFMTVAAQVVVLLALSRLAFGIRWGSLPAASLATVGLVASAAGFGLLLMSLVRTTRQAGPVMGGVLSVTGMAGGLMTTGFSNLPGFLDTISLLLPQGWALRCWKLSLAGAGATEMLLPTAVTLAWGAVLFAGGVALFRRRFA
ncbi:MAG: ABC transporter permease, partial [Chloroflexi bacterium]|nr:ABC transporter permease [Chloroflexota bacterium]